MDAFFRLSDRILRDISVRLLLIHNSPNRRQRIPASIEGRRMGKAMNAKNTTICREDEHEWCEIPLHEDCRICAKCGEIREDVLFTSPPNSVRSEAESLKEWISLSEQ